MIKILLIMIFMSILSISMYSQEEIKQDTIQVSRIEITDQPTVMNIRHRIQDDKIIVTYDLMGPDINKLYEISVIAKIAPHIPIQTTGIYSYRPVRISGDVGRGIRVGRGKQIIWDYKREIPDAITEDDVWFRINIQEYRAESNITGPLLRSAVLPGWGQLYGKSNTKGLLFMIGAVGTGGFFFYAHTNYAKENDKYERLWKSYESASTDEDLNRYEGDIHKIFTKVNNAYLMRNIALYTAVGIYVLNLIDILFFPSQGSILGLYTGQNSEIRMQPRLLYNSYGASAELQITF